MPSRSQPSWTSGYCASRARAAASASSSLPSWMSASTAFDASALALFCSLVFALRLGRRQPFVLDRLVLRQATRLYFLPLPQGQRSLRLGLAIRVWPQAEKDGF